MAGTRFRRLGITTKLIIPFVGVFVSAVTLLGLISLQTQSAALSKSLEKKAESLVWNLATALSDPYSMGEYDLLQKILEAAKNADDDVVYAMVIGLDGRGVASTDTSLRNESLTRNEFEASALKIADLARRDTPTSGEFEMVMPVRFQSKQIGVLRIGITTQQIRSLARQTAWTTVGVTVLALVVGVAIYLYVARRVVRPLSAAVERLQDLAMGDADLTLRLPVTSRDEAGELGQAMNTFLDKLRQLIQEIRQTSVHVAAASEQLSGASAQLSSGAQQQASSLEETAASLEEITGTVRQNADSARHASQLALGSRETAEKGGRIVATAVAAMSEINRSSKKIAEIITTIDEIAFQTNLLALNAAVEAARAGEQGRGFAVVAAEVRNLAQRSAVAAKEIKGLIQESVLKVEGGSELVNKSGQTLEEIVASVKRVTDIIAEIAAASQEQSQGIEQVNKAVGQMDQVVQVNAAQTEEVSSTARTLTSQAQRLQTLVGRFKLKHGAVAAEVAVAPVADEAVARPSAARILPRAMPRVEASPVGGPRNGRPSARSGSHEEF